MRNSECKSDSKSTCLGMEKQSTLIIIIIHVMFVFVAPAMPDEQMVCEECHKKFAESFLHTKFQLTVCDQCR